MNLEQYEYRSTKSHLDYEFYSDGPNGKIRKVVRFMPVPGHPVLIYNLSFGDWDERNSGINDFVVSDNKDAEKVLATVANTLIDFTDLYPDAMVYAEGSTASRTRRYQMGISKYWLEIKPLFEVFGLVDGEGFQPFEKNMNYRAFLVRRKKS